MAEDQKIQCAWDGCRETFVWGKDEQDFYKSKGFKPPRFCKAHRAEAKKKREEKRIQEEEKDRRRSSPFNPENIPGTDRYRGSNDREKFGL